MRNFGWMLCVVGTSCVPSTVRSAANMPTPERAVLERAIALAGPHLHADLPIVLTSVLPPTVSANAEAWTVYDEPCKGARIFVYTGSRAFRCASGPERLRYQCDLKVASIVVHEA